MAGRIRTDTHNMDGESTYRRGLSPAMKTSAAGFAAMILAVIFCPMAIASDNAFRICPGEGNEEASRQEYGVCEVQDRNNPPEEHGHEDDQVKTLAAEVSGLAGRAAEDGAITTEERDSVLILLSRPMPDGKGLTVDFLKAVLDSIETRYDRMAVPDRGTTAPDRQMISTMLPGVLPLPDDFVDKRMERFRREMAAAQTVKDLTTQYLERIKPWQPKNRYLQLLFALFGHFIPTNGMDPSFKSTAVMNGLYYIPCVPGQPLEFDESIFRDTKHFDPLVYRPTRPQMEYDPGEGLHFRAYSTPNTGGASLPNVFSGEYATPPNR